MNTQSTTFTPDVDDYIDTNIVFGEIKKIIMSQDFKGGKVHNMFGATELDFSLANLKGMVVLDISQAFGETKITVPKDWRVETDLSHFCSAEDDHRRDLSQTRNSDKVLVITGTSAFAELGIANSL
jgi:predicted membrane protein